MSSPPETLDAIYSAPRGGIARTRGILGRLVLLAVIVLPFYVPVLIFGVGASGADAAGGAFARLMLAALLAASLTVAPFVVGKALAISQEY